MKEKHSQKISNERKTPKILLEEYPAIFIQEEL